MTDLREAFETSLVGRGGDHEKYAAGHDRPLSGYLATMVWYAGTTLALAGLTRLLGRRPPARVSGWDLVLWTGATHKLARLVSKDAVTSPLRAPFTRYREPAGHAEVNEEVRAESSGRHAVGELVSCPFCLAVWIATGFGYGLVLAPGPTRLVMAGLTSVAGSDFLQLAYERLKNDPD